MVLLWKKGFCTADWLNSVVIRLRCHKYNLTCHNLPVIRIDITGGSFWKIVLKSKIYINPIADRKP